MDLSDMIAGSHFYTGPTGHPLAYMDQFWFLFHPEVYVFILPAFAIWLESIRTVRPTPAPILRVLGTAVPPQRKRARSHIAKMIPAKSIKKKNATTLKTT